MCADIFGLSCKQIGIQGRFNIEISVIFSVIPDQKNVRITKETIFRQEELMTWN